MKKFVFILIFCFCSIKAFASPARFGGFSYKRDELGRILLDEETEAFNEGPAQLDEEPQQPYYLDENDIPVVSGDKYKLIYTIEDVYEELDKQNNKSGSINYNTQAEKYKTPPIYSLKDLHEGKLSVDTSENNESEEDMDEE